MPAANKARQVSVTPAVPRLPHSTGQYPPARPAQRSAWGGSQLGAIAESSTSLQPQPSQTYVAPALRAQSRQPSVTSSQAATGTAGLAQAFNNMTLQQQQAYPKPPSQGAWDPSVAPAPQMPQSKITTFPQGGLRTNVPTNFTVQYGKSKRFKWFQNDVCVRSPYTREDFKRGQVICVPFHVANMNENTKLDDIMLSHSHLGPVLSKRRMFIILYVHREGYFCLPLYSFGGRGIVAKRGAREVEYIPVMNTDHRGKGKYKNESQVYDKPLVHKHEGYPWNDKNVCHLTDGVKVGWQEQITTVGRITKASFVELMTYYSNVCEDADNAAWEE